MLILIVSCSSIIGATLVYITRSSSLWRPFAIYEVAWHIPIFFYLLLPFSPTFHVSTTVVASALSLVQFVLLPSALVALSWRNSKEKNFNFNNKIFDLTWRSRRLDITVMWCIAIIGVPMLLLDLYYFRGLTLLGSVHKNRQLYDATQPSIVGYFAYVSEGFAIFLLTLAPSMRTMPRKLLIIMPYIGLSTVLLSAGVRQFMFFGIILLGVRYAVSGVRTSKFAIIGIIGCLIFAAMMVSYNIIRQPYVSGNEAGFVQEIGGFKCTKNFACQEDLSGILLSYLYQYFGNEYIGLTVANQVKNYVDAPLLSQTFPVLYRRFQDSLGLPTYQKIRNVRLAAKRAVTGYYPNFWSTMYSSALVEGGWLEAILVAAIASLLLLLFSFGITRNPTVLRVSGFSTTVSALIFGVMFVPTRQPFFVILVVTLLISHVRLSFRTYSVY